MTGDGRGALCATKQTFEWGRHCATGRPRSILNRHTHRKTSALKPDGLSQAGIFSV